MKMQLSHRSITEITTSVFILVCIQSQLGQATKEARCPIGFQIATTKEKGDTYCIRLKGPEYFNEKFEDCAGNKFTAKLYRNLNFSKPNIRLWADYKSLYPGGVFIDWSYADSTGDILPTTYEVNYDPELGIDEELCTVIEPDGNLAAVRCDDEYNRYCIVKTYHDSIDDINSDGCEEYTSYYRFWSPRSTCLSAMTGVNGGNVRATWRQATELCEKHRGTLLQRGWRYANHPLLHVSKEDDEWLPLGMVMASKETLRWITEEDGDDVVPDSEWSFSEESLTSVTDRSLVALSGDTWKLVNSTYIFYDVVCEVSIHLRNVSLNVTYSEDGQLSLTVNDTSVDESKIWCFSDSVIFYPSEVKITQVDDTNKFILKPLTDGYYWCIHSDSKNFEVSESNKELFIRDKPTVIYLYAIKLRAKKKYNFEDLEKVLRVWTKKLSEYIFLTTKYKAKNKNARLEGNETERILKEFKFKNPDLIQKDNVLGFLKFKRIYLDAKTALLHAQVSPDMEVVSPGFWEGLEVVFMKPAYYCKELGRIPMTSLGKSVTLNCRKYTCVGDFNEGVQWLETADEGCDAKTRTSTVVTGTMRLATEATTTTTTTTTEAPEDYDITQLPNFTTNRIGSLKETTTTTINVVEKVSQPPPTTESLEDDKTTETTKPIEVDTTTQSMLPTTQEVIIDVTTDRVNVVDSSEENNSYNPKPPPTTSAKPPPMPTTPVIVVDPEEQLQSVLENLELLLLGDAPVSVEDIGGAFDELDNILELEDDALEIPGELLHMLDELGSRVRLNGSHSGSTIRNNVALLMADAGPENPCRGLKILASDSGVFTEDAFEILSDVPNATHLSANTSDAVVQLPSSLAESRRRVSFVVFRTDRAFQAAGAGLRQAVNSRVMSVNVENVTQFSDGEVIDLHFRPMNEYVDGNQTRACAYWEFQDNGTGFWSQEGCTFIKSDDPEFLDTCRCTHLTHFAEILVPSTSFSDANETALKILSLIGCVFSLIGIIMIGVTAALFRSWRRDFNNKVWLQLCIAIFLLVICFFIIVFADFQASDIPCMLVGVVLHYSVLSSFCWMLVSAIISYRRLVLVFTRDASHKLLRASAFSWGAPCAVVGILLSIDPRSYAGRFEESTTSGAFCYPSGLGLWLAVYAPIALMLLANWTLFALIVRSVFASRRIQRHGDSKEALRCATVSCLLVFLFGLPWIFGLFASNIVAAYLFNLTATFQGFVLFIFFVLGNKKTRDLWLNKLKIKQSRKVPVTSSTYKSTGAGWKGGSERGVTIEANMSKPRSLASSDDSRFS